MKKKFIILLILSTIFWHILYYNANAGPDCTNRSTPKPISCYEKEKDRDFLTNLGSSRDKKDKEVLHMVTKNWIEVSNRNNTLLNIDILLERKEVVYGEPFGKKDEGTRNGEYRFLGYNHNGDKYPNMLFEADYDATGHVGKSWIAFPWENDNAKSRIAKAFDSEYRDYIQATTWLENMKNPYDTPAKIISEQESWLDAYNRIKKANWTPTTLLDYVVINTPPTEFGPGVVTMYNTNGLWYQTFFIAPMKNPSDKIDIQLKSIELPRTITSKQQKLVIKANVFIKSLEEHVLHERQPEFKLVIDGKQVYFINPAPKIINIDEPTTVTLEANIKDFKFTKEYVPLELTINPDFKIYEPDTPEEIRLNNKKTATLHIKDDYDLLVERISTRTELRTDENTEVNAVVKNNSIQDEENVKVVLLANNTRVGTKTISSFSIGDTKTISFNWKASSSPGPMDLAVVIDPDQQKQDDNRYNNAKSTLANVRSGVVPTCATQKPNDSWTVIYRLITGYEQIREPLFSEDGKTIVGYKPPVNGNPIYAEREVTYRESLAATIEVNTKQGIQTDPKNPKAADRESRGSWAIIPWAREHRYNPNEVTRAGYGFEVKVTTRYTTDWETKVPRDGRKGTPIPKGGTYTGPTKVEAQFFDTKGRWVETIELEKTSGNGKTDAWQIPLRTHRLSTGEQIHERKHYTPVTTPDGQYTVRVLAMFAGAHELSVCEEKKVQIYGSMYEDTQNIRIR
jgi:hypothetical protein